MKKAISIILFIFSLISCKSISNFSETQIFFNDLETEMCFKKIKNDFWIEGIERKFSKVERAYLDSIGDWDFDDVMEFESKNIKLKIHFDKIIVNYQTTIKDLKISNKKRTSVYNKCKGNSKGYISIPLFNKEKTLAIVETQRGTFIYKKNETGKWVFDDIGLVRSH